MTEDMIWHILDQQFCSFKTQLENEKKKFCKNEYNLTGTCSKFTCPLANGRYATVLEENGILYLHVKTIERAHTPANLWEKIQLPSEISGALKVINENLAFWPKRFVNKVKERLVRLHQYLIRYRKWYYRAKPRLVTVHKKYERREQRRELKALIAAKLDVAIKQELLERLKQGTYEPFINLNNKAYMELLREEKRREKLKTRGRKKARHDTEEEKDADTTATTTTTATASGDDVDLSAPDLEFVEAEDDEVNMNDMDDMEDQYIVGSEEEDEDEDEDEDEVEYERELELEDDGQDALREDILKHIPISLDVEDDDDDEIVRMKRRLLLKRKKKVQEKQEAERKRAKDAQKKRKRYGAHVEIEYEPSTTPAETQRVSSSSSSSSW